VWNNLRDLFGADERGRVAERVRVLLGESAAALPEPTSTRPRWVPSRRAVAALGLGLLVVVVACAWWYLASSAAPVPVDSSGLAPAVTSSSSSVQPASPTSTPAASSTIVVDVAGKVVHPGIYRLPTGSRVFEAVHAAGGVSRGASTLSLNLAAPLQDGEQVVVGLPGGGGAPQAGDASAGGGAAGPVDLNSATVAQLDALPGVGPVLAQHIIDWRTAHGRFSSVNQLQDVSGIGDAKFADLKPLVTA
jgi:competence protein ComEA